MTVDQHADQPDQPTRDADWYLAHLVADAERFVAAIERGPLDAPVESCGDWTLADLVEHQGFIHRWARFCAANARRPGDGDVDDPFDPDHPVEWFRRGVDALVETLGAIAPDAPTWHPFPVERVAAVWPRRQAHEISVHRWDAERAVGVPSPIDPELAGDGIDEYFEVAVPRLVARTGLELPTGSIHLHCTDVAGEWLVWNDPDDGYRLVRAHQKGDAALRGPAEAILLLLWGRTSERADELSPVGDETVLAAWTSIHGM